MTDNEIIKALECCAIAGNCTGCYYNTHEAEDLCTRVLLRVALALINRQKAELDDFREIVFMDRSEAIKQLRTEAVKEFAERLKKECGNVARMEFGGFTYFCVGYDFIDNLVKEFAEGEKK